MPKTAPKTAPRDPDTSLILPRNPAHNVMARLERAKHSLADLATVYLVTEAAGHSQATLDAKRRDLQRFLSFYQGLYRHDRPEEWFVSGTKALVDDCHAVRLPRSSGALLPRRTGGCRKRKK